MSDLFPVSGGTFSIGGTKATQAADFVAGDFSGETWVAVDGWEQMGAFGDEASLITLDLINRGRTLKAKGTFNAGQMANRFAYVPDDTGQGNMITAAADSTNNYAFRVELNDAPADANPGSGSDSTPTTYYFVGIVMSQRQVGGNANTPNMLEFPIEINSNVVKVARVAGT